MAVVSPRGIEHFRRYNSHLSVSDGGCFLQPGKRTNAISKGRVDGRTARESTRFRSLKCAVILAILVSAAWVNGCSPYTVSKGNSPSFPSGTPGGAGASAVAVTQPSANSIQISWTSQGNPAEYRVIVDDTQAQRHPLLSRTVNSTALTLDILQTGLAPGVTYYATVNPGNAQTTFRLASVAWPESQLSYVYAQNAWANVGRLWMDSYSGVAWDSRAGMWTLDNSWQYATTLVAQQAYNLEYISMAGVNLAAVRHDLGLLNELASFYLVYQNRFTTLGAMRAMTQYNTSMLPSDPDSTKTLLWVWVDGNTTYVRECDLCNSQFYYSVSRLLRIITTLPPSEQTPAMLAFVNWYAPVLKTDHLLRLLWRDNGAMLQAVQSRPGALTDTQLWLAAESAELLGASANEPDLVALSQDEQQNLETAIKIITSTLFNQYRTYYPTTQNLQGQTVGSVSYFNGAAQFDPSEYEYSGYTGSSFPSPTDALTQATASWDVSHIHRVPIFLRALYDNRKATGIAFPSTQEIQWVTNQFVYLSFKGDFSQPLFNNYFDGSNGWYRVGYDGANFGYPPAEDCDNYGNVGPDVEPCLTTGLVHGWGLLSFMNPDLEELQHSLAALALSENPAVQVFRQRYYYYAGQDYAVADARGDQQYPLLLLYVIAGDAQHLQ